MPQTLAQQVNDKEREGFALAGKALASLYAHKFARCFEESRRAIDIGRTAGSGEIVAAGRWTAGFGQALTGHLEEGRNRPRAGPRVSNAEGAAAPPRHVGLGTCVHRQLARQTMALRC